MTSGVTVLLPLLWCLCECNSSVPGAIRAECVVGTSPDSVCYPFSYGKPEKNEFFSPGYPNLYPNRTCCKKLIDAGPGHFVKVKFIDNFEIETSDECKSDYIDFKNVGTRGVRRDIGRVCGYQFPNDISSSGQNMLIVFNSDDSVENNGFVATYEFHKADVSNLAEQKECLFMLSELSGNFGTGDITEEYINHTRAYNLDTWCTWQIAVPKKFKVMVSFTKFKLQFPNDKTVHMLTIENSSMDFFYGEDGEMYHYYGMAADSRKNLLNTASVHLFVDKALSPSNSPFVATYTAYTEISSAESCRPDEFSCGDKTCLDMSLKCNKIVNCRSAIDEENCKRKVDIILTPARMGILAVVICGATLAGLLYGGGTLYTRCKDHGDDAGDAVCGVSSIRANSLASGLSDRFGRTNVLVLDVQDLDLDDDDPDNHGCYVPEVDLKVFHKRFNGCGTVPLIDPMCHEETPLELPPPPPPPPHPPPQNNNNQILAHFEPDFPPPPPIYYNFDDHFNAAFRSRVPKEDQESEEVFGVPNVGGPNIIMMPRSFESVKSAPDII